MSRDKGASKTIIRDHQPEVFSRDNERHEYRREVNIPGFETG
jgi:hypothetical protein